VLVPLLTCVFAISNRGLRRGTIAAIMILWSAATPFLGDPTHGTILFYLPFFLAGFLVCDLQVTRQNAAKNFLWDVIALIFWPLIWLMPVQYSYLVLPPVIVLLYLAAFRGRLGSAVFSNRFLTVIGGMCYSIYLFHFLFISTAGKLTKGIHFGNSFWFYYVIQGAMIVPLVLIACAVYFIMLERPCMDREWPRKLKQFLSSTLKSSPTEEAAAASQSL
jgi:peptidoglycan/LPS O-acetylase OafA/YrhL